MKHTRHPAHSLLSLRQAGRLAAAAALAMLAACASSTNPAGLRLTDLRSDRYLQDERILPGSFADLQKALITHERACGESPTLRLDQGQTSFATLMDRPAGASNYAHTILVDLVAYQPNHFNGPRMRAKTYSYYMDEATQQRMRSLFAIVSDPGRCAGAVEEPTAPEGS